MAFLKFNKSELVNLEYSLRREILESNKSGAYLNTTIVDCNTRKYHGLLAVTLDRFGGNRYLLLSQMDESLCVAGKEFNLGIRCYGSEYLPKGHKYIVDFEADPVPAITYRVGEMVLRKRMVLNAKKDQVLISYELLKAPYKVKLSLKPFLAFRSIHTLTHRNPDVREDGIAIENGISYRMYRNFPDLNIQFSRDDVKYLHSPHWNMNITYSDEYRRGFDCREDLFVPGYFDVEMVEGDSVILSASLAVEKASELADAFETSVASRNSSINYHDQLVSCADSLVTNHSRRKICSGLTWMLTGLLRETLQSLAGLTLYGLNDPAQYEEILDNLIEDEQQRLFYRTTQVESPLYLAVSLQKYIEYGASAQKVWSKYGETLKKVLKSYLPGVRREVAMHPNGLLWAQMDGVALSWMNAYINGRAVTERSGYQVETNALWYNAICFAVDMEKNSPQCDEAFVKEWGSISQMVRSSFQKCFWNERMKCLADYVNNEGQHLEVRPNQIYALWVDYSPVDEELFPPIMNVIKNELVTARGIRTLSPRDVNYRGVYNGSQVDRDLAYHQGSTRTFLLEPYVEVSFRMKGAAFWKRAEWLVEGFFEDLNKHGVGAFSELYDGDPPHEPHGAISSARSTAALLAVERMLEKYREGSL